MDDVNGLLLGGTSQNPLSLCSVPFFCRVLLVLVSRRLVFRMYSVNAGDFSIENTSLGIVYSEKETEFCRKLTDVGLSVGPGS